MLRTLTLTVLIFATTSARATIIWNYNSNDGTLNNVVTGSLTTTGNPGAEQSIGVTFSLLSIDTVFFNGVDISVSPGFFAGEGPSFATIPSGSIKTDSPGHAMVSTPTSLIAQSPSLTNGLRLASPLGPFFTTAFFNPGHSNHFGFFPVSTTFTTTPAPEPSSFLLCLGLFGMGLLGLLGRKRRIANRHPS